MCSKQHKQGPKKLHNKKQTKYFKETGFHPENIGSGNLEIWTSGNVEMLGLLLVCC